MVDRGLPRVAIGDEHHGAARPREALKLCRGGLGECCHTVGVEVQPVEEALDDKRGHVRPHVEDAFAVEVGVPRHPRREAVRRLLCGAVGVRVRHNEARDPPPPRGPAGRQDGRDDVPREGARDTRAEARRPRNPGVEPHGVVGAGAARLDVAPEGCEGVRAHRREGLGGDGAVGYPAQCRRVAGVAVRRGAVRFVVVRGVECRVECGGGIEHPEPRGGYLPRVDGGALRDTRHHLRGRRPLRARVRAERRCDPRHGVLRGHGYGHAGAHDGGQREPHGQPRARRVRAAPQLRGQHRTAQSRGCGGYARGVDRGGYAGGVRGGVPVRRVPVRPEACEAPPFDRRVRAGQGPHGAATEAREAPVGVAVEGPLRVHAPAHPLAQGAPDAEHPVTARRPSG